MLDLILVTTFCVLLFRMARKKGVSPAPYILNYIVLFVMMMLLLVQGMFYFFGPDILKPEHAVKLAIMFEPVAIGFEVCLFFFLKWRIAKIEFYDEDENEHPSSPDEKKDLSYFR